MSTGVLITLIICSTILLIFVIALIGSNQSKRKDDEFREIEQYIIDQTKDKK